MKKNYISKAFAVLSSVAILGVSSIIGASAATTGKITIADAEGYAGDTVSVSINIEGNPGLAAMAGVIEYDSNLVYVPAAKPASDLLDIITLSTDENKIAFGGANGLTTPSVSDDGEIVSFSFTIPEDAEVGTVYDITWALLDSFEGVDAVYTDDFTLVDGTITVIGDEEETTPEETTVAETTVAETTPAATVPSAPKTGASTKGIAATTAVLLAAACSAVVLKKKRD